MEQSLQIERQCVMDHPGHRQFRLLDDLLFKLRDTLPEILLNISRTVRDPLPFGLILLTQRGSFTTVIVVKLRNSSADLTVDQTVNISYLRIEFIDESSFCSLNRYFQLAT